MKIVPIPYSNVQLVLRTKTDEPTVIEVFQSDEQAVATRVFKTGEIRYNSETEDWDVDWNE